ncbi:MAG: terminase TerL endonuclease subunit, partial [Oscillospiraceae bacterium]
MDRATNYAENVVKGKVVACEAHIKACKRHLKDLEKQGTKEFPFFWDCTKSQRIIDFSETLTIAEGTEPKPLKLFESQCFDLGVPFGWINENGFRRFRRSYESMARQNGKTFKNGIRGAYISGFGGYNFGKLFTAATKKRQAKIAFDEIAKFIKIDKDLNELYKIQDYKTTITSLITNCTIEALSKEGGLDDGFRSIFNSIDEIHQHRDNSVYKALYNGTRNLPETLNSMITTRGKSLNSFCYEMDTYCLNILNGTATADDFFVDIYTLDEKDSAFDEKIWIKANPILCQSEQGIKVQKTDAQTAKDMGGMDLTDYLVKCCNMWVQGGNNQYIKPEDWKKCGCNYKISDFKSKNCYAGLDLSSGGDLTTISIIIQIDETKFYIYTHSFMPRSRLDEHIKTDTAPYDLWEKNGLLTVTDTFNGIKNDYKFIISHLKKILSENQLNLMGIGYDPYNADGFLSDLDEFGVPIVAITQSARFLSPATENFELTVRSGDILYDKS